MTTAQQLRDYFDWHCQLGRGAWQVEIDPRSVPCHWSVCQLSSVRPPAPERMVDESKRVVFIDGVLEK